KGMRSRHGTLMAHTISQFPPALRRWNEGDQFSLLSACSGAGSPFVVGAWSVGFGDFPVVINLASTRLHQDHSHRRLPRLCLFPGRLASPCLVLHLPPFGSRD